MMLERLTKTQRESIERSRAFRASIAARAVPQRPAPERSFGVKGDYVPPPAKAAPAPPQGLQPQAMPAEPDPPLPQPLWFYMVGEREVTVSEIQAITSEITGVSIRDLKSARRTLNIVRPRQVAMYVAKMETSCSMPHIGRCFGGRDHTTILHAVRQVERLMAEDEGIARTVEAIRARLRP